MQHLPRTPEADQTVDAGDAYPDLDEVYRDNVTRVYRLIFARVGNRSDAEDLTSSVFLAALPRLRPTAHRAEVRAYLAATARTTLAGHWRRRLGREVTTIELFDGAAFLAEPVVASDAPGRARRILDALPERYARILELRFLEGLSIKDAACSMGVSVANAKVLQHRALAKAAAVSAAAT